MLSLEEVILEYQLGPCRACFYVLLSRRSLERLKLALMRSVVVILRAALLFPPPQLNSAISFMSSAAKADLNLHISNKAFPDC